MCSRCGEQDHYAHQLTKLTLRKQAGTLYYGSDTMLVLSSKLRRLRLLMCLIYFLPREPATAMRLTRENDVGHAQLDLSQVQGNVWAMQCPCKALMLPPC